MQPNTKIHAPAGLPFFPTGSGEGPSNTAYAGAFDPPKTEHVDLGEQGGFSVHKGALHRALHVPEGEKIPAEKLAEASRSKNEHVRNMARSAKGFAGMSHGGS